MDPVHLYEPVNDVLIFPILHECACIFQASSGLRQNFAGIWFATHVHGRNLSDNWGEEGLFIYSCYAQRISFEIQFKFKRNPSGRT